jgi:hypothetical protein
VRLHLVVLLEDEEVQPQSQLVERVGDVVGGEVVPAFDREAER